MDAEDSVVMAVDVDVAVVVTEAACPTAVAVRTPTNKSLLLKTCITRKIGLEETCLVR